MIKDDAAGGIVGGSTASEVFCEGKCSFEEPELGEDMEGVAFGLGIKESGVGDSARPVEEFEG